ILSAPEILQLVYVMKIVSIDETKVIENVPDVLAGSIPRILLIPQESVNVTVINQKQWTQEQAVMLFGSVASVSENTEELSEELLQGFTCTSVQTLAQPKVKQLVKACRHRPGRQKVQLKESQLMCMYNYMKDETSPSFTDLPSDILLYYNYEKVEEANCRSYFSAVGTADYSVLSSVLDKQKTLFNNAQSCLGISGQRLSRDHVEVLGNLTCTLDPVYIQNSDPAIIESLKKCHDLSDAQISAVQLLLLSGETVYGNSSAWDQQTLERLDTLPLYFTDDFWSRFSAVRTKYMKVFMPFLRTRNTEKPKLKKLFKNCNAELDARTRIGRSADCTAGNITEATIADASFPFGYTAAQFDACMSARVLRDNLAAVSEKVDDNDFQGIILSKLKQVYPAGLSDSTLQLLASVSRQATVDEIRTWSITSIDTLTALMDSNNGEWNKDKSKEVILRYLSVAGHTLGTNELNVIGSNICALNILTLQSITARALSNAEVLDLSSCSYEQKSVLYSTAKSSFSAQRSNSPIYFHLISPYLGKTHTYTQRYLIYSEGFYRSDVC
uniref:Si:ch211-188p14.4 n=1 Tax=Cyprinus carpio TaxID=7962 RepID=A0A8C1VRP7_CYPCA